MKLNTIDQIYDLQSEKLVVLNLPIDTDTGEIHNEAYQEGFVLYSSKSLLTESIVALIPKPTDYTPSEGELNIVVISANIVAQHLLEVIKYGEQSVVSYNGDISLVSVRAMCYKVAKERDMVVKSEIHNNTLYVKAGKKTSSINNALNALKEGESITLPTALHTSIVRLRAVISNYSKRYGKKFKTRLVNDNYIAVYCVPESDIADSDFKKWVKSQPWDVVVDVPKFEVSKSQMYNICRELFNGAVKIDGKTLMKFSKRQVINNGEVVIVINGKIVYRTGVPRVSALTKTDISELNEALSIFGVSYEHISY